MTGAAILSKARNNWRTLSPISIRPGNENAKFTLICHSAGGLIARYYVKYGGVDVLDSDPLPQPTYSGAGDIEKVIMLGTPNRGSLEAFWRLHRGLWVPAVGHIRPETAFTMPSFINACRSTARPCYRPRRECAQ
jgi:hypothetical protein